ncbi:family 10 glycosylhydrolase [Flavobacterium sp. LHD-80]|uniref:family 10 glycosylhydrolase n=1 Tax=Flavobacterium sp. LHD-80 TaxID=3071411 RepID=UPI0027E1019B|nr:family 10 glycosylhydrolase [Flavobacterium sp. LHD-80]MDQ6473036.1 family 10 glycosylhydrolase [Flavobacterium sp. LHD-80]
MKQKLLNLFFLIVVNGLMLGQGTNILPGCSNSGAEISASPKVDLRGTYLTSVYNLDWPSNRTATPAVQQAELITILDKLVLTGINTVYFQVRPECDALYNSSIEPWSYWLTGTQGVAPNPLWDPLSFAITECRKRGLDLHAWLNPYRASVGGYTLANNHVSKLNPSWVFTASNNANLKILNPGLPAVKNYIISIVQDIASRYDIDGIVFDDYFYPDQGMANNQDAATYANNNPTGISNIDDWRRDNVNKMIAGVYDALQVINATNNKNIVFGVAPFGIWKSGVPAGIVGNPSYSALYCDPINWLQNGKVDFISPQLYWKIGGSQDYIKLSQWWNDQAATYGRHLYVSQGYDRLPSTSSQNWPASEIQNQIDQNRIPGMTNTFGQTSYSTQFIMSNEKGIATTLQNNQYKFKSFPPSMPWKDNVCPLEPTNIRFEGNILKWDAPVAASDGDLAIKYVVYAFATQADIPNFKQDGTKVLDIVNPTQITLTTAQLTAPNNYFLVTALDKNNNESANITGVSYSTLPAAPVAVSPTEGQLYVNSPVNFSWSSTVTNGDYRIQVSKSATGWTEANGFTSATTPNSTVVVNDVMNTTMSYVWNQTNAAVYEAPIGGTTYYYTIRSYSAATGTSKYSLPISFTPKSANCTVPGTTVITVDNLDATLVGSWTATAATSGFVGTNYIHDGDTAKGTKTATFTPTIAQRGKYEVFINHTAGTNRANNVPVDIIHESGTTTVPVNQQINNGTWISLGTYNLSAGTTNKVVIRTTGTSGVVIADAVRFYFIDCLPDATPPVADFTPASATLCAGQTVTYTNASTNATSYSWSFPGGTPSTSTAANPVVTYNTAGTYNVALTATNGAGSNTKNLTNVITVNPSGTVTAGFTAPYSEVATGENMTLTNTSTGATTYAWTFPNGSPATSTAANPTVNFTTTGTKTITLVASNSCGSTTYTMTICVGTNTKTTLETFESSAGRFTSIPTASGSTTGIATTSTLARATDSFKNGTASLKAVLNDNTTVTTNWLVRLLSGGGTPANNQAFVGNQGSFGFWLKTSTANAGATVTAWIDDVDGLEELPPLAIINNGTWNYYEWFLPTAVGTTITTGNGVVGGASVTLDAIVIKQNNTATTMTVWIDDIQHNYISACSGTRKMSKEEDVATIEETEDIKVSDELIVYPNPTNGILNLKLDTNIKSDVRLFNVSGQQMLNATFEGTEQQLDLNNFGQGIYLLQVTTDGKITTKKIILNK